MAIWRFITELFRRWTRADVPVMAASLAFHSVLALVPLLAISLAVFQYVGGLDEMLGWIKLRLMDYFVFGTHELVMEKIESSVERIHGGALGLLGLVFITISGSRLFYQFNRGIQKIWQTEGRKTDWLKLAVFWGLLIAGPLTLSVLLGYLPKVLLEGKAVEIDAFIGYPLVFALLLFIYQLVPNTKVIKRVAFFSALLIMISMHIAKWGYIQLTSDLMSYNKVYGSMAALPVFLIWILILWWLVLFGVALSAQWQAVIMRRNSDVIPENSI